MYVCMYMLFPTSLSPLLLAGPLHGNARRVCSGGLQWQRQRQRQQQRDPEQEASRVYMLLVACC